MSSLCVCRFYGPSEESSTATSDGGRSDTAAAILIVDDNKDSADSLAMLLEITGNKTYMAHDGSKRWKRLKSIVPKLCCSISVCRGWMDMRSVAACASSRGARTSCDRADGLGPGRRSTQIGRSRVQRTPRQAGGLR